MRFLRPEALWLLLAALPLALLHLRRVRRRVVPVASVRLWRDLAATGVGRRGLRRLRESGALAILLAALVALAAALADPVTGAAAMRPSSLVIVLDGSVTMNTRDGDGTRFDAAREAVAQALERKAAGDDVTVWLAAGEPWVLAGPTRDVAAVRAALAGAAPTLEPRTLGAALERARAARALRREPATMLVVSDAPGAVAVARERGIVVAAVGSGDVTNTAVQEVARTPRGVRVRIASLAGEPGERTLRVTVGDELVAEVPVVLSAGREIAPEVLVPGTAVGRLVARLVPPDDFPDDDANGLVLRREPPLRVLVAALEARAPPFLLEALRAMPGLVDADAALLAGPDAAPEIVAAADVVIAVGAYPDALRTGPAALPTNPAAPRTSGRGAGEVARPHVGFVPQGESVPRPILWGIGSHPVLDGVDLAPLRLAAATPLPVRPGETTLIDSAAGPLAVAGSSGGARYVHFGFRPGASTLPLEPAFPLLVRNALRWVRGGGVLAASVSAGRPLRLADALPPGVTEVIFSTQDGSRRVALGPDVGEPSAPTPRPGADRVLRVGLPGGAALGETMVQWRLPAGTALAAAEPLAPASTPSAALASLPRPLAPGASLRHLAPWLAGLAAALLLLGAALLGLGGGAAAGDGADAPKRRRPVAALS